MKATAHLGASWLWPGSGSKPDVCVRSNTQKSQCVFLRVAISSHSLYAFTFDVFVCLPELTLSSVLSWYIFLCVVHHLCLCPPFLSVPISLLCLSNAPCHRCIMYPLRMLCLYVLFCCCVIFFVRIQAPHPSPAFHPAVAGSGAFDASSNVQG